MEPIAHIRSPFAEKFGVPRQGNLAPSVEGVIEFAPAFRNPDCLRGIEQFSHLWLIWGFDRNGAEWSPTVRPPRLGGNVRLGVFATRSPFRPNGLGLSVVRLLAVEAGGCLRVSGADLVDGTPIYDSSPTSPTRILCRRPRLALPRCHGNRFLCSGNARPPQTQRLPPTGAPRWKRHWRRTPARPTRTTRSGSTTSSSPPMRSASGWKMGWLMCSPSARHPRPHEHDADAQNAV